MCSRPQHQQNLHERSQHHWALVAPADLLRHLDTQLCFDTTRHAPTPSPVHDQLRGLLPNLRGLPCINSSIDSPLLTGPPPYAPVDPNPRAPERQLLDALVIPGLIGLAATVHSLLVVVAILLLTIHALLRYVQGHRPRRVNYY